MDIWQAIFVLTIITFLGYRLFQSDCQREGYGEDSVYKFSLLIYWLENDKRK